MRGGPPGDLYILLSVRDSREFQRDGNDISTEVDIGYVDAILGATLTVRTIDGEAQVEVPAGSQPNTKLRMKGRGVPMLGRPGIRGDHSVRLRVRLPRPLSASQIRLLNELKEMEEKVGQP